MRTSVYKFIPRLFDFIVFGGFAIFLGFIFHQFNVLINSYPTQIRELCDFVRSLVH